MVAVLLVMIVLKYIDGSFNMGICVSMRLDRCIGTLLVT